MLQPKRTKYRKFQKGVLGGKISNTVSLTHGRFGLRVLQEGRCSSQMIEAARRTMTRKLKRVGQIWIRVFPDQSVSEKPAEVRMGKGKGNPAYWMVRVKPGQILFELDGVQTEAAKQACRLAAQKLNLRTLFCTLDS